MPAPTIGPVNLWYYDNNDTAEPPSYGNLLWGYESFADLPVDFVVATGAGPGYTGTVYYLSAGVTGAIAVEYTLTVDETNTTITGASTATMVDLQNSPALFTTTTSATTALMFTDVPGFYNITVAATASDTTTTTTTSSIIVQPQGPIGSLVGSELISPGISGLIDMSATVDADNTGTIEYQITNTVKPASSIVVISHANSESATATFVVDTIGFYEFEVVMTDGFYDANVTIPETDPPPTDTSWAQLTAISAPNTETLTTQCIDPSTAPIAQPYSDVDISIPSTNLKLSELASFGGLTTWTLNSDHADVTDETSSIWQYKYLTPAYSEGGSTWASMIQSSSGIWSSIHPGGSGVCLEEGSVCPLIYMSLSGQTMVTNPGHGTAVWFTVPYTGTIKSLLVAGDGHGTTSNVHLSHDGVNVDVYHDSTIIGSITVHKTGAQRDDAITVTAGDTIKYQFAPITNARYDDTSFSITISYIDSTNNIHSLPTDAVSDISFASVVNQMIKTRATTTPSSYTTTEGLSYLNQYNVVPQTISQDISAGPLRGGNARPYIQLISITQDSINSCSSGNGSVVFNIIGVGNAFYVRLIGGPADITGAWKMVNTNTAAFYNLAGCSSTPTGWQDWYVQVKGVNGETSLPYNAGVKINLRGMTYYG